MLDLYFIMIAINFGAYTSVVAILNDETNKDTLIVVLTFLLIFISLLLTWGLYVAIPAGIRRYLRFDKIITKWVDVDRRMVFYLAVPVFVFNIYLFVNYGIISYVVEAEELGIPSWIGPIKSLLGDVGFVAYAFILALAVKRKIKILSIYGIIFLALMFVVSLDGRTAIFKMAVLAWFVWSAAQNKGIYLFKYMPFGIAALAALIMFSNIYQTYRSELFIPSTRSDMSDVSDVASAAGNIESTVDNLRNRATTFDFNYKIAAEQLQNPGKIYFGMLTWQSFLNSIPAAFSDSKIIIDSDVMVSSLYSMPNMDYPMNDFVGFFVDFGVLMPIFSSTIIAIIFLISASVALKTRSGMLYLIVSGFCINYLLLVEKGFGEFFLLFRHILLFVVLFAAVNAIRRVTRSCSWHN